MSDCTGLYIHWIEPLILLFHVIILGIATGAISLFLTKSTLLNSFHAWLEKKAPFFEEMLSCPWCTSHWIAGFFTLVYQPLLLNWSWRPAWMSTSWLNYVLIPVDYLVTIMVMVGVAAVAARVIYSAYKPIMG